MKYGHRNFISERAGAALALLFLTVIWGLSWPWWREALDYAGPFTAGAHRTVLAAIALFVLMRISGQSLRLSVPLGTAIVLGLLQTGLFFALQVWAVMQSGAGKTSVLIFTMPVWMLLMSGPLLGERIRPLQWLPVAVTVVGLLIFIAPWQPGASRFAQFLAIGGALCWAGSSVFVKRLAMRRLIDNFSINAWQMVFGALFLCAVAVVVPGRPTNWDARYIELLLLLGVLSTGAGWLLWGYILKRLPAWQAGLSVLGVPIIANISSHWMLGERSTSQEISGMLLVGAGLASLSYMGWRDRKDAPRKEGTQ